MGAILSEEFINAITEVIGYCEEMDMQRSFIQSEIPDRHRWKHILYIRSVLGNKDISQEEAKQLLKTDMRDNVMVGSEDGGWEELTEEHFNENGDIEPVLIGDTTVQLWII